VDEATYYCQGTEVQSIESLSNFLARTKQAQCLSIFALFNGVNFFRVLRAFALGHEPHSISELHGCRWYLEASLPTAEIK
jgi:hypothetical protein